MTSKVNYAIQARNATAVNILRAWLGAVDITHRPSEKPGCDLTVTGQDGTELEVQVLLPGDPPADGAIHVKARDFTGKRAERALEAFYAVTDAAGYPRQEPLDRGAGPAKNEQGNPRKLHYRDDDFLVAVRHTEFRRSPNPPAERLKFYKSTMEKTAWRFFNLNYGLCVRNSLGVDDLLQYASCWVVNFIARYETQVEVHHDNERKCYRYLQQRFNTDLKGVLLKKERSALPDAQTVSIGLYGRPDIDGEVSPDPSDVYVRALDGGSDSIDDMEPLDLKYLERHQELDLRTPETRQASAAAKLQELLGSLPHERLVEVLRETVENRAFDIGTQREAARQLRIHVQGCDRAECVAIRPVPTKRFAIGMIPQANRLGVLRLLVQHCKDTGESDLSSLSEVCGFSVHETGYYRQGAVVLNLMEEDGTVTDLGRELLLTDPMSEEERAVFRDAIETAPGVSETFWFFEDDSKTVDDLVRFITKRFEGRKFEDQKKGPPAESTIKRRAGVLKMWRAYLAGNFRIKKEEQAAGTDPLSAAE